MTRTIVVRTRAALARRAALPLCLALLPCAATAASVTECTAVAACYCVNGDFKDAVADKVDAYRKAMAAERAKGKAVGYMSVPLSSAGGGMFAVNREIAAKVRERVEARLGSKAAFVIDPAAREADLPTLAGVRAGQGDYLLMWTRVLEGPKGLGEDLDFVYFVGPADVAEFFALTGKDDLERLGAYFDERAARDPEFRRAAERANVTREAFRNHYGLRASVAFSAGAHDEWNVIRAVNQRRRDDKAYGITGQLPVFFDGRALAPGVYEQTVSNGNAGACKAP